MLFDVGLLVPGMPCFSAPGDGKNPGLVESMAVSFCLPPAGLELRALDATVPDLSLPSFPLRGHSCRTESTLLP